jgi:hypothetical protein
MFKIITALTPFLALTLLSPGAIAADTADPPSCKRNLDAASAAVTDTLNRLKGITKAAKHQKCAAYREHFLIVVRARAVFASCKTGVARDHDVGRLDGTIEDINGAIAESCTVQ